MENRTVTHLIAGLGLGGAETMLYQVLSHRRDENIKHRVISLGAESYYEQPIRDLGIDLTVLPFKKEPVRSFRKIKNQIKQSDVLCCWMYAANLIGGLTFRGVPDGSGKKIIWNIRHSNLDRKNNSRKTLAINDFCAKLSGKIDVIAYNGEAAREVHEAAGYTGKKAVVLENGCDLEAYLPDGSAGASLRRELGQDDAVRIVLSVAKDDPIKDLPTFIEAFGKLKSKNGNDDLIAVMCGRGVMPQNDRLARLFERTGLTAGKDVFLLGLRHDVPRLLAGGDLYVLHSAGEAFPNTLIQAMACGCLCVTTDVGDAGRILMDRDLTVPPGDPARLAEAMAAALSLGEEAKAEKRERNREIVREKYDIRNVVKQYEDLFR